MNEEKELCRTLALGSLMRGYFHNLRGTLQNLSLHLQMLYLKKEKFLDPQGFSYLEKAWASLEKRSKQIDLAVEDLNNSSLGPWDLKEIMEEELLFWSANPYFKHKVNKELEEKEKTLVSSPLNELKGFLCLLQEILYSSLKENSFLKIFIGDKPKTLTFLIEPPLEEKSLQRLFQLKSYFSLGKLELTPPRIDLIFF